jgi:uncharacterized protein YfaS (alpha-2-macroglobulin family)
MKTFISLAALLFFLFQGVAKQVDYPQLKAEAERAYAEGSYAQANETYGRVDKAALPQAEVSWVEFRLADTLWRAQAATETPDKTKYEQAQKQLFDLVRAREKEEDRDSIWAEVHESLGDFFWLRRDSVNWSGGWPHYQIALDWWAGQRDLNQARDRYLRLVFKASDSPRTNDNYFYTYYGNYIPLNILENALKISKTEKDQSYLHFLIAMTMRNNAGDWDSRERIADEFEAALKAGKKSEWYDDALFHYASWINSYGKLRQQEDGQWIQETDFTKAIEMYRRLLREFSKGETRYYDQALQQIQAITEPSLNVGVSNIFLPTSELQYVLNARNVGKVNFALYRVDLTRDVRFTKTPEEEDGEAADENVGWIQRLPIAGREVVKSWVKDLPDKGEHRPFSEQLRIEGKLPVGAYVLEATSGKLSSRDLLLVTDASLVLKTTSKQAVVFFANAMSGAPIPNATVALWESYYLNNGWHWRRLRQTTNSDGLATFTLKTDNYSRSLFVTAAGGLNSAQAFSGGNAHNNNPADGWRIYAFTDRPAYRPKETVQWKFIARQLNNGVYSTPANQVVEYQITDPRGTKVSEGKATLNAFGSAWSSFELGEQLPLGPYNVQFWDSGRKSGIGSATLFRLEEYKLPEFKVSVKTPEVDGKKKSFRLGEQVETNIQADYYFGGPVRNAAVEVVVYQKPFYHYWFPQREYYWYYDDLAEGGRYGSNYGDPGQVVKREIIKTDATGKATLTFDTPRENYNQDFEYRVEAKVTDSSRREIVASDNVRVTRQRYYVYPRPERNIYRPKDKITVDIKALDANEQPVSTTGTVKITRDYWWEVWLDPTGREVKGEELRLLREKPGVFPPAITKGQKPWQLKFRGYQHDDIATQEVKTDAEGNGQLTFQAEREGYYRLAWQSSQGTVISATKRERKLPPIAAEAYVFVANNASNDLGYRQQGVEIVVDKDTVRAGQTTPVMLFVPESDRYVLFSVEGDDLYSYQVVHVTGTAKLIELPINETHVPNVYLSATMITDAQIFSATNQLVVPPVQQFLTVDVKSDRMQYEPREEGTLWITTKDVDGKPVATEVALGLIDESVKYIQQDFAGDPRQFYYGNKRTQQVQTQSTFNQKQYARLVEVQKGQLVDLKDSEDDQGLRRKDEERAGYARTRSGQNLLLLGQINEVSSADGVALQSRMITDLPVNGRVELYAGLTPPASAAKSKAEAMTPEAAVQVRSDFRSTMFWQPDVQTDSNGTASIKVKYPDSLTTWQATARVASTGNQFGIGNAATRTKQPLIVRLQAPRFFVVGDQATVSGVINNNTDQSLKVAASLQAEGVTLRSIVVDGARVSSDRASVEVKPGSEARVDWLVAVTKAGEAKLKVEAHGGKFADAMERTYAVYEHGIEKFVSRGGKLRGESVTVNLDVPAARRAESTDLTVQIAPSLAVTMLDALPYLIDYPYGCTEQTMSRFLPAVITAKTLRDLGLKPEAAMNKVFGGVEQETAQQTHPHGKRDLNELNNITRQSLERLYNFQHPDGGWGWWREGESDHFMTAYVLWGLSLAREAGVEIRPDVAERAAAFLDKELVEAESSFDLQAWMLHALSVHSASLQTSTPSAFQTKAFENLFSNRDRLNAYTRALLALSAHYSGRTEQARVLVRNLENGVKLDSQPDASIVQRGAQTSDPSVMGTAHWGEDGLYWRWSDGGVEATSFVLRALLAIDPQNKLIEPVTNWLIKNRRGAQWSNTRDTAIVVLTLNDYLKRSGELSPSLGYELLVNGRSITKQQLSAAEALSGPSKFAVPLNVIRDGANTIEIRRTSGSGPLYFSAEAKYFSLEDPLTAAGNEIFVRRQYFKLVNHPTLLKGIVSERVPLLGGETIQSGDRVEAVLTIESKNNYEYLLFEDLKPAGLEAVQLRSGENVFVKEIKSGALNSKKSELMNYTAITDFTGRTRWVYQELRDRKVALFIDKLPEGVWQVSYEMRAEVPGTFHALPVLGHAMYVPEIRTNGAEVLVKVIDGPSLMASGH